MKTYIKLKTYIKMNKYENKYYNYYLYLNSQYND